MGKKAYYEDKAKKAEHSQTIHESVGTGKKSREGMSRALNEKNLVEEETLRDVMDQVGTADKYQNKIMKKETLRDGVYSDLSGKHDVQRKYKALYLGTAGAAGVAGGLATAAGVGVAQAGGLATFTAVASGYTGPLFLAAASTTLSIVSGLGVGVLVMAGIYKALKHGRINKHKDSVDALAASDRVKHLLDLAKVQKRSPEEVQHALNIAKADVDKARANKEKVQPEVLKAVKDIEKQRGELDKTKAGIDEALATFKGDLAADQKERGKVMDTLQKAMAQLTPLADLVKGFKGNINEGLRRGIDEVRQTVAPVMPAAPAENPAQ